MNSWEHVIPPVLPGLEPVPVPNDKSVKAFYSGTFVSNL